MGKSVRFAILALTFLLAARSTFAQDGRYQPPRPPPLDGVDFDEGEDDMEMGDDAYRPPPNSQPGGIVPAPPPPGYSPPPSDYGANPAPNYSSVTTTPGKFRFKLVDGLFWEKGKKRSRGPETRVTGEPSGR